jgi:uncharacterized protein
MTKQESPLSWSRYNRLFCSDRFGPFLYNILSNTLMELDRPLYDLLAWLNAGDPCPPLADKDFEDLLCEKYVLVKPGQEEDVLLTQQCRRHVGIFNPSILGLTICPTLRCNFRCSYCFETSQAEGKTMSRETRKRIVEWIRQRRKASPLSVTWYGGEPLLAFDVIRDLTESFMSLDASYDNADLVTNGYLLNKNIIAELNDLKITSIQLTLDGPRQMHDVRRVLAGGGPTFDRIMANLNELMHSDYAGSCKIRVNVDRRNLDLYLQLRTKLLERFKGAKLFVYPGLVDSAEWHAYGLGPCLNMNEWAEFNLELYRRHRIIPPGGLHPASPMNGLCIAAVHNGFVVGPEGELYKCWDDVGKTEMIAGNVYQDDPAAVSMLQARYVLGMDAYSDAECLACDYLPICGGGCVNKRMRTRRNQEQKLCFCTPFAERLTDYLEAYIDILRGEEICEAVISPHEAQSMKTSYRVISPDMNRDQKTGF